MITAKEAALQSVNANHGDLKVLTDQIDNAINKASKSGRTSVAIMTSVEREVVDAAMRIAEQAGFIVNVVPNNDYPGRMIPGEYGIPHKYTISIMWGLKL